MLKKNRIFLATLVFICITWLFVDFTGTAHGIVPITWLPKIQLLEAIFALNVAVVLILLVITLIFGRIYCSVVCPLGILQDIFGWFGKRAKKNRYTYSAAKRGLRLSCLLLLVVSCLLGVGTLFQLLAPYSTFGIIATNLLQPIWQAGNNVLAAIAEHYDSYAFYHSNIWMRSLPSLIISIVAIVALAVLAWRNGRTFCNTICPVGTFLSFFAKFSWMKVHFDVEKCKNCSLCTKHAEQSGQLPSFVLTIISPPGYCHNGSAKRQDYGWWIGRYQRQSGSRQTNTSDTSWLTLSTEFRATLYGVSAMHFRMSERGSQT